MEDGREEEGDFEIWCDSLSPKPSILNLRRHFQARVFSLIQPRITPLSSCPLIRLWHFNSLQKGQFQHNDY